MVNKNKKTMRLVFSGAGKPSSNLIEAIKSITNEGYAVKVKEPTGDETENDTIRYNGNDIIPCGGYIERAYEENLGGHLGRTIYDMRANNEITAKAIGDKVGALAATLTETLVGDILDYVTEAVAHASDSARNDAVDHVEMCRIVNKE